MSAPSYLTVPLGDVVAAVFDEAEHHSVDSGHASYVAARVVAHMLRGQPEVALRICALGWSTIPMPLAPSTLVGG